MNHNEFLEKINSSDKPIVVDFWAEWCGPCKMTKPILEKVAKDYDGQVEFLPINADQSREILEQYRVFGIPTVISLRKGKEVARITGTRNEEGYRAMFQSLADGGEVKIPLTPFDRMLRLGGGGALIIVGLVTSNWLVAGIGGIVAFLGVYDRCPIWNALTGMLKRRKAH